MLYGFNLYSYSCSRSREREREKSIVLIAKWMVSGHCSFVWRLDVHALREWIGDVNKLLLIFLCVFMWFWKFIHFSFTAKHDEIVIYHWWDSRASIGTYKPNIMDLKSMVKSVDWIGAHPLLLSIQEHMPDARSSHSIFISHSHCTF